jgi:hypothetical protein
MEGIMAFGRLKAVKTKNNFLFKRLFIGLTSLFGAGFFIPSIAGQNISASVLTCHFKMLPGFAITE